MWSERVKKMEYFASCWVVALIKRCAMWFLISQKSGDFSFWEPCGNPYMVMVVFSEYFCAVTAEDIQRKVAMGTGKKKSEQEPRLLVERVADRFNQVTLVCTYYVYLWCAFIVVNIVWIFSHYTSFSWECFHFTPCQSVVLFCCCCCCELHASFFHFNW